MGSRVRVYELARELGLENTELIELLNEEGLEVKSHSSSIEEDIADLIREHVIAERQEERARVEERLVADVSEDEEDEDLDEGETDKEIHLKPPVVVRDLAEALGKKPNELIGQLMTMNVFASINQVVDLPIVEQLCERNGFRFVRERRKAKAKTAPAPKAAEPQGARPVVAGNVPRPPVVAFMGHVDHGKTSLQDAVRNTKVTAGEAGGITQHIGASVITHEGKQITFIDTPGHEAFTAMRARGANSTDIAIIVVAADDGVMPQTIEAIKHAKAAGVPMIVAINKMDLPGANPDKVLLGLQRCEVHTEDWGGDVGVVRVSAQTGEGLDDLLERILLESEMMELKCDPAAACEALVIEAQLEQGMGPTANILVQNGTLKVGDIVLCGQLYGKVKAMIDCQGKRVKSAGPSCPVKLLGLSGVAEAGARLQTMSDEREAKRIAEERAHEARQGELGLTRSSTLEDLFQKMQDESMLEIKIILKTDVRGSIEAIVDSLQKIKSEKIRVNIVHSSVGEISENDVLLAAASGAILVGFHVRVMPNINRIAKAKGVEIRLYTIIYELLSDIEDAMRGKLAPELRETPLGEASILQIFNVTKTGKICGCMVNGGLMRVGAAARVYRESELIYKGHISSLRRFQDDVKEVRSGLECGIKLDNFEDFEVDDRIEAFDVQKLAAQL